MKLHQGLVSHLQRQHNFKPRVQGYVLNVFASLGQYINNKIKEKSKQRVVSEVITKSFDKMAYPPRV
jgi:hypothetical protein